MKNILKIEGYELLSQKIYGILKAKIVKGSLKQGSKLSECKIAKLMGISRTPVREALRELAANGFVKMNTNHGVVVTSLSLNDIIEAYQVRGVLEGLATRLTIKKIGREEIRELDNITKQMIVYAKKKDILAFSEMDAEFHDLILNTCGNKRLIHIHNNLNEQVHRFRIKSLSILSRLKCSLDEHLKIAEAIKKKDLEKADKLSQIHINNVLNNILTRINKEKYKNEDTKN